MFLIVQIFFLYYLTAAVVYFGTFFSLSVQSRQLADDEIDGELNLIFSHSFDPHSHLFRLSNTGDRD